MFRHQQNFRSKANNINLHKYKCFFVGSILTTLLGCAHTSETFDCKFEKGLGCRSITEVNQMVNRGEIKGLTSETENHFSQSPAPAIIISKRPVNFEQNPPSLVETGIQRIQERSIRIWLAPFQDEQGNFHEASIIHSVLKPGSWQWQEGA